MISAGALFLLLGLATSMWYRRLGPAAFEPPDGAEDAPRVLADGEGEVTVLDAGEPESSEPAGRPS
jgi:hypothetical protein